MSMDLMVKAMKTKVGNPLRKLVLIKLADNANDQGECWPSYQHIADQCEIDRSTVRKHIKHLGTQGLLRIENRDGPKGNSSNLYHLTLSSACQSNAPVGLESTGVGLESTGGVGPESTRTSHSSEPVNEPKPMSAMEVDTGFSVFWSLYPRKENKSKALSAWKKLNVSSELLEVIIAALSRQCRSVNWLKSNGQYVPLPTTWLNGKRWEDETPAPLSPASRHTNLGEIDHEAGLELDENGNWRIAGTAQ